MSNENAKPVKDEKKNPFQDTLNLPQTEFSIRANAQEKEPELLKRWASQDLYSQAINLHKENGEAKRFVLHDGPPYANGYIHLGHALNRVLKDVVTKSKRMSGMYVPFTPGWDCHGLPIELKMTAEVGVAPKAQSSVQERLAFKKACRKSASTWIDIQKEELKALGCVADWDNPYLTMSPKYEASILRAFAVFVDKGHIERKGKTVPWCMSCQTVLATAEIEHKDRKDPSLYVAFSLDNDSAYKIFPIAFEKQPGLHVSFLIWTTTPWTIPLNRAVVLHPSAEYVLLQGKEPNTAYIIGKELATKVCADLKIEKVILAECDSIVFNGAKVTHPLVDALQVPIILDDSVQLTDGTACVHSAPGCGPEDYMLGIKNGLEIYSPLSVDGKYTVGILPEELLGMSVTDGQIWVIKKLAERGKLIHKASLQHSYPHCWRCRNGLIFRATDQWFCDLKQNNLVEKTREELKKIKFYPEWGQARLEAFVQNRSEWCISRQRQWGVPITAVMCSKCDHAYINADFVNNIASKVEHEGIEYWDRMTVQELQKEGFLTQDFACSNCKNNDVHEFRLERDILDVWFDSGVSHYAVLVQDKKLGVPCDLYLEGSDQHRGWFQSSLLCSMVLYGHAQTRAILTHGFTVDENKEKMSKSIGNVVAPQDLINKYSRDILRLWLASTDYEHDLVVSDVSIKNASEIYRKIRNTCRFMISNLYDFDLKAHGVNFDDMHKLDQYILSRLYTVTQSIKADYSKFYFTGVVQTINNFCVNDLSATYLDILKDRLYVERPDGHARRSGQTALYHLLDMLTHLMAPILSFAAEEISDFYLKDKTESIHLRTFPEALDMWRMTTQETGLEAQASWNNLEELRSVVFKAIEEKRQAGLIKHSLEAKVTLFIDKYAKDCESVGVRLDEFMANLALPEDVTRFFKDWFIVSQISFAKKGAGLEATGLPWAFVKVEHAQGAKCQRCWQWDEAASPVHMQVQCKLGDRSRQPRMHVECKSEQVWLDGLLCTRCKEILSK
ncbi:MAG: isoleucine--tRNA ligase [bacterium]